MLNLTSLDKFELINFTKILHEARFPDEENDPTIMLSSYATEWHAAAIDEQKRRLQQQEDEKGLRSLETWRQWRGRREENVFRKRLETDQSLRQLVLRGGPELLRKVLRPFVLDDESAADLVEYATRAEEQQHTADDA